MEEPERVPVFHTRLARTQRRRLLKPDGSSAGWLIVNAADSFATVADGFAATSDNLIAAARDHGSAVREHDSIARVRDTGEPAARDADDPPQLAIPHPR